MESENSLFSFFSNIKNKISSFFSSETYSSKKDNKKLFSTRDNNFNKLFDDKNYLPYLIKRKTQKSNRKRKYQINSRNSHSSIDDTTNLSSTLSNISSKDEYYFNNSQINGENVEYEKILLNNNSIEGELDFKNSYRINSCFLGKKNDRNFFDESIDNISSIDDENNNNINGNISMDSFQEGKIISENLRRKKEKRTKVKKKKSNEKYIQHNKEVRRLSNEYSSFKRKLKIKNKINNIFLRQKESNGFINEHTTQKKDEKKANKHPFENLTFTHPERFSLYSTNKKRKLEKSTSKKKNNSLFFSISNENDINIIQPIKNDKKEDNDQVKSFDKNCENLNISSVKNCEINKINNLGQDFSVKDCNNKSDINLSKLIDANNQYSSNVINFINNPVPENNNFNNTFMPCSSNNCNINYQDHYMDIDENNFDRNKNNQNNNQKETTNNSFQKIGNNNTFLINIPTNTYEKVKVNNKSNNDININSNNLNNKTIFEGKNLFNIKEKKKKKDFQNLIFSFGKK